MCHIVYDFSNNERINTNEQIRNKDDEDDNDSGSSGDTPPALSDASENQFE